MVAEKHSLRISAFFCIYLSLLVIMLPIRWIVAILAAAGFHEFCHWLAIQLICKDKTSLQIGIHGAEMKLPPMRRAQEFFCTIAGPLGSLMLLGFIKIFPKVAVCGLLQGLYNLLPIFPLDGGRAVHCMTEICFSPPIAKKILCFWDISCVTILLILGFITTFVYKLGLFPMILLFGLVLRKNSLQSGRIGGTIVL